MRAHKQKIDCKLTGGPGTLSQTFDINLAHNSLSLIDSTIWIEDKKIQIQEKEIEALPRIGIDYAGEDALLLWRFRLKTY